ncbi:hypothetical protein PFISCL1PPCAC_25398 [Pristionchus fissidentatus]|uniref:DREV methyltransferase n=1 Tax=Pristionchus fissidentatus TaxID=1538716 RepID=A0AAV5WSY6_9BILA|nr:hypothetical protein PFISCL1PPCAC_25398 [Pristionchus fissidentatus]
MRLQRGASWSQMLIAREAAIAGANPSDRSFWYMPKMDRLSPSATSAFSLSYLDPGTQQFLDDSLATTESMCLQMWYSFASTLLSLLFTKTNINGLLGRGGMFLFSAGHIKDFLELPVEWTPKGNKLLDLGSGDGGVTRHLATFYDEVHVTEMSTMMQWRLRQKGYKVVDANDWDKTSERYSLISALNLLDRHFSPRLLLSQLHKKALNSGCAVLLSLVLPIKPYVEFHPNGTSYRPDQYLAVAGHTLEEQVSSLVDGEFRLSGFEVAKWTKLPYLCEGDLHKPYYRLDDVLFLLVPVSGSTVGSGYGMASGDAGSSSSVVHNEL